MIVRTYGRRKSCISRNCSDSGFDGGLDDSFRDPLSQEISQESYSFAFSSQESSPWSFDSDCFPINSSQGSFSALPPRAPVSDSSSQRNGVVRKSKKQINTTRKLGEIKNKKSSISKGVRSISIPATSTLMEAQEFGEIMEHVDELNFALDGLRKGQPSRIQRASLLSLLSICSTVQQRRLLRAQGTAKTIIDSILGVSFDDSPSTLAAAALFYILASDGQDDHLLDSPTCIHFLLKLLKPPIADTTVEKAPTIGSKLLALHKDPGVLRNATKILDSTSSAIILKVHELLLSCKEIKVRNVDNDGMGRPELSPKWIALLTIEKACLSAVSLEDTSATVRRIGGNFKEKLREFGGLDAVVDVVANCHSTMEGWLASSLSSIWELKDDVALQNLVFLLKCLKIMENATFLSNDNQNHLLGVVRNSVRDGGSLLSFAGLILRVIKILSGLSLLQSSSSLSSDEKHPSFSEGMARGSELSLNEDEKDDRNGSLACHSSRDCSSTEDVTSVKGFKVLQKRQRLSSSQSRISVSSFEAPTACSIKKGENSFTGSLIGRLRNSDGGNVDGSKMNAGSSKRPNVTEEIIKYGSLEDSQDPFAFDEDEWEPSKWDLLSVRKNASPARKSRLASRDPEEGCEPLLRTNHHESSNSENHYSCEASCSSSAEKENSELLDDCLLTAVKVLMNLTNDNPVGCQQIAACGGLETMSDLIICHFPSFSSCLSPPSQLEVNFLSSTELDHSNDRHLTDQELDFLVAILGLLVNLVEKDSHNRSRLAAASVSLPSSRRSIGKKSCRNVIRLLCTVFLANQGAGEAVEDGRPSSWDDEAVVMQGEREAEKMIIEAYAALLLAFLSTASESAREAIASCLPDHNLEVLVPVLERFVAFHLTLNMISPETHKAVSEVIESCRGP